MSELLVGLMSESAAVAGCLRMHERTAGESSRHYAAGEENSWQTPNHPQALLKHAGTTCTAQHCAGTVLRNRQAAASRAQLQLKSMMPAHGFGFNPKHGTFKGLLNAGLMNWEQEHVGF